MTISEKQQIILSKIEMDASIPLVAIRKATNFRSHTIRYGISCMERDGIVRRSTFINVYPIGYVHYAIYFSLSPQSKSQKQSFLDFLVASPNVSWLAELGGDYQYAMAISVRNPSEVSKFLSLITETFGNVLSQKSVHVRTNFTQFNRKYINAQPPKFLSFGPTVPSLITDVNPFFVKLDATDHKILRALGQNLYPTEREAQFRLQIPHTTWRNRVNRLREQGVIIADFYLVSPSKLGMQSFELLVHAKGVRANLSERLLAFATSHPRIVHFVEGIGEWDFELGVEVENAQDIVAVTEEIHEAFADDILALKTLPLFANLKYSLYPFV